MLRCHSNNPFFITLFFLHSSHTGFLSAYGPMKTHTSIVHIFGSVLEASKNIVNCDRHNWPVQISNFYFISILFFLQIRLHFPKPIFKCYLLSKLSNKHLNFIVGWLASFGVNARRTRFNMHFSIGMRACVSGINLQQAFHIDYDTVALCDISERTYGANTRTAWVHKLG